LGEPDVVFLCLSGAGQDEGVGEVIVAADPVKLQQAVKILEELVYQKAEASQTAPASSFVRNRGTDPGAPLFMCGLEPARIPSSR
jgi:hypothetical protein